MKRNLKALLVTLTFLAVIYAAAVGHVGAIIFIVAVCGGVIFFASRDMME